MPRPVVISLTFSHPSRVSSDNFRQWAAFRDLLVIPPSRPGSLLYHPSIRRLPFYRGASLPIQVFPLTGGFNGSSSSGRVLGRRYRPVAPARNSLVSKDA